MKVTCIGLDYGFGGTPILSFGLQTDLATVTPSKTKDIELAIGAILEGRQVVLSGKEITMHNPAAMAPHEASMYTSVCQSNAELAAVNKRLHEELDAATAKLALFQSAIDNSVEAERRIFNLSTRSNKQKEALMNRIRPGGAR